MRISHCNKRSYYQNDVGHWAMKKRNPQNSLAFSRQTHSFQRHSNANAQGPDNYVVQNASFCLSKLNDFVQNFVQNAVFLSAFFQACGYIFQNRNIALFQYILVLR